MNKCYCGCTDTMPHSHLVYLQSCECEKGVTLNETWQQINAQTPNMKPTKEEKKSKCCNAPVRVGSGDEGTNWYECIKCNEACDTKEEKKCDCGCIYHGDVEGNGKCYKCGHKMDELMQRAHQLAENELIKHEARQSAIREVIGSIEKTVEAIREQYIGELDTEEGAWVADLWREGMEALIAELNSKRLNQKH